MADESYSFVVVSNRLPVDRVVDEAGNAELEAVAGRPRHGARTRHARRRRRLGRMGGPGRHRARRVRRGRHPHRPRAADRVGPRALLRGFQQRHPVAAVPRCHRAAQLPPRLVGQLRAGQPALRGCRHRDQRPRRHRVGAGLPAAAGAGHAPRAAARPRSSASSTTSRSRRTGSSRSCRGAGRSSTACSVPTSSASSGSRMPATSRGRCGGCAATPRRPRTSKCRGRRASPPVG